MEHKQDMFSLLESLENNISQETSAMLFTIVNDLNGIMERFMKSAIDNAEQLNQLFKMKSIFLDNIYHHVTNYLRRSVVQVLIKSRIANTSNQIQIFLGSKTR